MALLANGEFRTTGGATTSLNGTISGPTGAADEILSVWIWILDAVGSFAMTCNGVAVPFVDKSGLGGTARTLRLYQLAAPTGTALNSSWTTNAEAWVRWFVHDGTSGLRASSVAFAAGLTASVNESLTCPNLTVGDQVCDGLGLDGNITATAVAGTPGTAPGVASSKRIYGSYLTADATSEAMTWTLSGTGEFRFHGVCGLAPSVTGPTINTQPVADTAIVEPNIAAEFTVAATTSGGALSYDWELETSVGGEVYANVADGSGGVWTGATTATLGGTFSATTLTGRRVRCNVSDSNGTTTTNAVALTIKNGVVEVAPNPATTNASGQTGTTTLGTVATDVLLADWPPASVPYLVREASGVEMQAPIIGVTP